MVEISQEEITKLAEKISRSHLRDNFDKLVWRLAELELILETGTQPNSELVRQLAESIAEQNSPLMTLHWLLAEKLVLIKEKWNMDEPL